MSEQTMSDKVEQAWEVLVDYDSRGMETYSGIKKDFPTYFAATRAILNAAHEVIELYASSLGKPEYQDIERDEWKIGHDYNTTDATGICFWARVNVGNWRDGEYRIQEISLPWTVVEDYINNPEETRTKLRKQYAENAARVKAEAERKFAKDLAAATERTRIEQEKRDRNEYARLKAKFES